MSSRELIDTALRVLAAIDHGRQPAETDLQILKSQAGPDQTALSVGQLAGEIIKREIEKHRAFRKTVRKADLGKRPG